MVEITSEELNKVKRMKRADGSLRDLWEILNAPMFKIGVPKKKIKRNGMRNFLKRL